MLTEQALTNAYNVHWIAAELLELFAILWLGSKSKRDGVKWFYYGSCLAAAAIIFRIGYWHASGLMALEGEQNHAWFVENRMLLLIAGQAAAIGMIFVMRPMFKVLFRAGWFVVPYTAGLFIFAAAAI